MRIPPAFVSMILTAGGTAVLAKTLFRHLAPGLSQTDIFHLYRLPEGSGAALDYLLTRFSPAMLLAATERCAPANGTPRSWELTRLQEGLLKYVDAHGHWK